MPRELAEECPRAQKVGNPSKRGSVRVRYVLVHVVERFGTFSGLQTKGVTRVVQLIRVIDFLKKKWDALATPSPPASADPGLGRAAPASGDEHHHFISIIFNTLHSLSCQVIGSVIGHSYRSTNQGQDQECARRDPDPRRV
jgi:hypothetical protein